MILDEHSYWAEILTRISATDGHSDDSRCTERMREYAETICYVPLEHEDKP